MTRKRENLCFEGVLGKVVFAGDGAALRFYEYSFSTDADATPVFIAQFSFPHFVEGDVTPLLGCEVEIALFEDRAEVTEIYGDRVVVLRAKSVTTRKTAYDIEDYIGRVRQLDAEYARLNGDLVKARKKINEGHNLVIELLRRAEIKSAASEDLRQRQAAALAVLQRLLGHFAAED